MRQIKFRVWDNIKKEFLPNILNGHCFDTGNYTYQGIGELLKFPQFKIQQFTGFLDINGVEVYEGDIIGGISEMVYLMSGQKSGRKTYQEYEIVWNSIKGCWAKKDRISNFVSDRIDISLGFYPVIGNIFGTVEIIQEK